MSHRHPPPTLTHRNIMNLTPEEMQEAMILWGRENFAKRMGIAPHELPDFCRKHGVLSPTDNVRRLAANNIIELLTRVVEAADLDKPAEILGVSKATLKLILSENGISNGVKKADELDKDDVWDTAQRTGSVSLTAKLHRTNESGLRKLGLDRDTISDPVKQGYRARTGRLGEMAMMEALKEGGYKVEDTNKKTGFNTPGVDLSFERGEEA